MTVYRVQLDYEPNTAEAERAVGRLESGFGRIHGAIAAAAGAFGAFKLGETIMHLGQEAEDTSIALAGMLQAGGAGGLTSSTKDFNTALGMSTSLMAEMRKDARDLPGEFEDLINVFRGGLSGGLQAGKTAEEVRLLSRSMMAVSKTLQVDSQTAGREFAMMMEGRAGAHNVLFQRLHGQLQMTGEQFNKLSAPEKWAAIERALKGYQPAVDAFGATWSAVSSTTVDYGKQLLRIGSAPVFETVKRHLDGWNKWFEKNQAAVEELAVTIGEKVAKGMVAIAEAAQAAFGFIVKHKDVLIEVAKAFAAIKLGGMLGVGGGGRFGAWSGAGNIAANVQQAAGGMVAGAAFGLALDSLVGRMDGLNTAVGAATGAMAGLPGKFGLIGTALMAFHAALQWVANKLDERQKRQVAEEGDIRSLTDVLQGKGRGASIQQAASVAHHRLAEQWGFVSASGELNAGRFAAHLQRHGFSNAAERADLVSRAQFALRQFDKNKMADYAAGMATVPYDPIKAALQTRTSPHTQVNITNHNRFEQTIQEAADPERIMVKTRELLEQMYRHPTVSPYNRFATVR